MTIYIVYLELFPYVQIKHVKKTKLLPVFLSQIKYI